MPNDDTKTDITAPDEEAKSDKGSLDAVNPEPVNQSLDTPIAESTSEPVPTTVAPSQPQQQSVADPEPVKPSPGMLVLQWLTYAFWGWTLFSLAVLISMVMRTLLSNDSGSSSSWLNGGVAYILAAVVVLFIISIVTDLFYAKAEKHRVQTPGSNVIMIIHAVLFALFGIGALIMAVFGGVQMLIGESTDTSESLSVLFSGLIIAALYGVTLLRVLKPRWIKGVVQIYWLIMTVAVIAATILGAVGPAMESRHQKEDQAIATSLSDISRAVSSYANMNDKLPASLNDLGGLDAKAEELVDDGKVKYTAKERITSANAVELNGSQSLSRLRTTLQAKASFHYELCVEYKTDDSSSYGYSDDYISLNESYPTSPRTYGHKAGNVCYDLQTRATY